MLPSFPTGSSMEHDPRTVDYARPGPASLAPFGKLARASFAPAARTILGTTSAHANGHIIEGCAVAGFGLLVAIVGQIRHTVEARR